MSKKAALGTQLAFLVDPPTPTMMVDTTGVRWNRSVITFQMAELPGVTYDREFSTLAQAREFFAVPSGRQRKQAELEAAIAELRRQGLSQVEIAARIGVSERTVRNYEKMRTGNFPS